MRISDWSSDVCSSDLYRERIAAWPRIIKRYAVIPMQIGVPCNRQAVRNSLDLTANQPAFIRMNAKARGILLFVQILLHYKVDSRVTHPFWDMQILVAAHCLPAAAMTILCHNTVPAAHPKT